LAAILALGEINNRSRLIKVGAVAGLGFLLASSGLALWRLQYGAGLDRDLALAGASLLYFASGLAAGFVMLGLLPFIERAFGIVTNISLLELCDVNQPALKRLAIEAPGTYAHSLLIGTLAEAAAEAIGANGLLARVGAYFHDIGKVNKPRYYVENWQEESATHEGLTPQMSRLVITSHVKDGLEMADRLGLPPVIKNFITEHHGTTLVEYFYREAERRQEAGGGEAPAEEDYRYPGPKPQSVETAIVMLADGIEGAARSLKEPTAAKIKSTVHEMIMKRLLDGQLDQCGITLSDLHKIEGALTKALLSVYHGRIPYPAEKAPAEAGKGEPEPVEPPDAAPGRPERAERDGGKTGENA
jgi:putative nucleotidyltransferase with HDIG domain